MMKKYESTQEDMRGKHNNRPNWVSEWRKDVLKTLIKKLPNYRSHFTQRKKPKQVLSFP
jgi:outer membrane lipopolysaccharide assembly protein LptE/RlpB